MNALSSTFHELLADNLAVRPDATAWIDPDRSVSYAEAADRVGALAAAFAARGVAAGDRVIVHLRKSIDEAAAMFAVARLGAVVVNVNTQWTPDQLAYVAEDCAARLILVEPRTAEALAKGGFDALTPRVLVVSAEMARPCTDAPVRRRLDSDLAMIVYTSGSTGRPKGVMLSHRNLLAGARSVARYLRLGPDDRLLSVLPYSFDYGLNQLTTMMLVGGTVVHQPVAMATEIVSALERHRITGLAAVPPIWAQVVRLLVAQPRALPVLRRVTNSGGNIPRNILDAMPEVFPGAEIFLMYGLTEAFRSTYLDPALFAAKRGAIGRAIPNAEIHVVKPGAGLAGPGEQGELVHRGPLVSLGYWGRPEATAEKIRPCAELAHLIGDEPVVWSGDTVRIDADGDIWFVGRADAMIKTSGFRLSPDEVEDLICRSGIVGDAVAFGVADADLGQVVHVAVTPLAGFDEAALLAHCRRLMPSYMMPRRFHIWADAMPRTASGKLARPEIIRTCDAMLRDGLGRAQTAAE